VRSGGQPNGGNSSEAKDVSGGQRRGAPAVGVLGGLTRKYAEMFRYDDCESTKSCFGFLDYQSDLCGLSERVRKLWPK
jgi:hypothetical protein